MHRTAILALVAIIVTACGSSGTEADVVASVQVDDAYDVVVLRTDETDLTPALMVCQVPHGDTDNPDRDRCADVDPWRWSRTSISASLDPGPTASLVVVVHDQALFDIVQPASLRTAEPVDLFLPAGPIGSLEPLTLRVLVAESDLTADNAIGCLTSGLAGGTNPVFISAASSSADTDPAPAPPADLQTACL